MIIHIPPVPVQPFDIHPTFESRLRVERRIDRDFLSAVDDDRTDSLSRFRPGVTWKYGKHLSGDLQYQFAQDAIWFAGANSGDNHSDLTLANIKYKERGVEVTFGRQKISVGSERLIGPLEWSMTGRSFDGIRFKSGNWDLFAFKVGVAVPLPKGFRIAGATFNSDLGLTSLIFKHDNNTTPETNHWTLSHWWRQKNGAWSFDVEAAIQSGRVAGKDLSAWAFHGNASYNFDKKLRAFVEFNAASGGGNASNTYTFDNLLPTNHKFYGSMDLQSWRNMEELSFGIEYQCNPKWTLKTTWHKFALRNATDAWYGAGGRPNVGALGPFVDPTGSSGKDVGSEFNIELIFKQSARVTLSAGIGVFAPGNFVKIENGGTADTQYWGFAMAQFKY